MSNSCVVKVEGSSVVLYQHWNGNPEYMIPFLKEFYEWFIKERGYLDESMAIAQLVRRTAFKDAEVTSYNMKKIPTGFRLYTTESYPKNREYTIKADGIYYDGIAVK